LLRGREAGPPVARDGVSAGFGRSDARRAGAASKRPLDEAAGRRPCRTGVDAVKRRARRRRVERGCPVKQGTVRSPVEDRRAAKQVSGDRSWSVDEPGCNRLKARLWNAKRREQLRKPLAGRRHAMKHLPKMRLWRVPSRSRALAEKRCTSGAARRSRPSGSGVERVRSTEPAACALVERDRVRCRPAERRRRPRNGPR
jgi:hypothetical protein